MMPGEMVERVAAAIFVCRDTGRDFNTALARAAIAAMREPTEAMVDEGWQPFDADRDDVADAYRSMIDEALK